MGEANEAVEEELEVLSSIYGDDFVRLTTSSFTINMPHHLHPTLLTFTLPSTYPLSSPPAVALSSSSPQLSGEDEAEVRTIAEHTWREAAGEVCCYQTVEAVREFLDTRSGPSAAETTTAAPENQSVNGDEDDEMKDDEEGDQAISHYSDDEQQPTSTTQHQYQHLKQQQQLLLLPTTHPSYPPTTATTPFVSGQPYIDRKSVFIAHTVAIQSTSDITRLHNYLHSYPKLSRATHNITAYRLDGTTTTGSGSGSSGSGSGGSGLYREEGCDDDGEDRAGSRLLHLLHAMHCTNVWVCVSRWYGGVKLGSERFRIIGNVARQLLEEQGYGDRKTAVGGVTNGSGSGGNGRKASKR